MFRFLLQRATHGLELGAFSVAVASSVAMAQSLPSQRMPSDSVIRAIIKTRVDSGLAAGIVVGVLESSGARRFVAYGRSGGGHTLDSSSVFEIGSITKTFTASLLADMVARGTMHLDDPASKCLSRSVHVPSRNGRPITFVDLATQTSGLPRVPTNLDPKDPANPYADYSASRLYSFLNGYQLPRDPGSQYEYSNTGFALLGQALSLCAHLPLETVIRRRITTPLRLTDTRVTMTPGMRDRLAIGHDEAGDVASPWDLPGMIGAGGFKSTASDLLNWVAANLAASRDSTRTSLSHALATAQRPRRVTETPGDSIGLAWQLRRVADRHSIVWHDGGTGGYVAFAGFDPKSLEGVVVLANSNLGINDIGFHLLAPSLPLEPPRLPAWVTKTLVTVSPSTLEKYVGEYQLEPAVRLTFFRRDGRFFLKPTGMRGAELFATSPREFFIKTNGAEFSFVVDAANRVTAVVLRQGGDTTLAPRIDAGRPR